jgi:cytochrome oxidase Cu insertion factor (SCO1/SenC/PrrC family)
MEQAENELSAMRRKGARRTLTLLALVCAAPVIASYIAYYWLRPDARTNYGELLPPAPAPELVGARLDGAPFRLSDLQGRWVLLMTSEGSCAARCERELYATRQARTIQNREQDRIVRVLLLTANASPSRELLSAHPGMVVVRGDEAQWSNLPGPERPDSYIYLVDPRGNLVLRYPADPDIRKLSKDLERLLRASQIG